MQTYLIEDADIREGSDFFFDVLPLYIENIRVVDKTKYDNLKLNDQNNVEVKNVKKDSKSVFREVKTKKIRTGAWFPFYHEQPDIDLILYQIFSKSQLDQYSELDEPLFIDHCFVNCLKYFEVNSDTIDFARIS
jgi:hypothetical protein